jgi:hypothetical protein
VYDMKKKRPNSRTPVARVEQAGKPTQGDPVRPLKPRPALLGILNVIFAVWIIVLLMLYFTTVRPKHQQPTNAGARAGLLDS